jgi:hypothetical protein
VLPLPNHKVVFCAVPTLDEALYLCAIINSTQIQNLLTSFANSTAVSSTTLARLPIPSYDPEHADVAELVSASRSVYEAKSIEDARAEQQPIIDGIVERLLLAAGAAPESASTPVPAAPARRRRQELAEQTAFQLPGMDISE